RFRHAFRLVITPALAGKDLVCADDERIFMKRGDGKRLCFSEGERQSICCIFGILIAVGKACLHCIFIDKRIHSFKPKPGISEELATNAACGSENEPNLCHDICVMKYWRAGAHYRG